MRSDRNDSANTPTLLQMASFRPRRHGCYVPIIEYHRERWNYMGCDEADPTFVNATHRVVRFSGKFSLEALQSSVDSITARHRILRAHIVKCPNGPCFTFDSPPVKVEAVDISHEQPRGRIAHARRLASEIVWRPFLAGRPWLRVFAIRLSPGQHIIGFVIHHFVADAQSIGIATAELFLGHAAFVAGSSPRLPKLPIQYVDYVVGMNRWLQSDRVRVHEDYWRRTLDGAPPTRLPCDWNLAGHEKGRESSYSASLPDCLVKVIRQSTKYNSIAMLVLVLSAMATAISLQNKSDDIVIQTRLSGRIDPRLAGVIGAFFDTIAVRLAVPPSGTLAEVLESSRKALMKGLSHQVFSYHLVKRMLAEIGASEVSPVLNFFNYYDGLPNKNVSNIRRFDLLPNPPCARQADEHSSLFLRVVHDADGVNVTVDYLDRRYRRETIERFVKDFVKVLRAAVAEPSTPLSRFEPKFSLARNIMRSS